MKITDFRPLLDNGSAEQSQPAAAPTGRELQELLSPLSSEEFVNSYFARTSLNVPGHARKFDHIFNWEQLKHALARGQKINDKRHNITASFSGGEEHGSARRMMNAEHSQVSELLNAGATVCITNIHMADPALAR